MKDWQKVLGVVGILVVGYWLVSSGTFTMPQFQAQPTGAVGVAPVASGACNYGTTTIFGKGYDPLSAVATNINMEVWSNDGQQRLGETQANAALTSLSTAMPSTLSGFVMAGNDNLVSTTDRGTEYYYAKKDFAYDCVGSIAVGGDNTLLTYAESTPTWTGYDDGTSETTLNVSVGSGATVSSTELKIASAVGASLGNPAFANPLAVCFNASTTLLPKLDYIRPTNYVSTFTAPKFLNGYNMLPTCYVLPTQAVKDGAEYRFYLIIKALAGQDPAAGESSYAFLLDKTYYKDDNGIWQVDWAYNSNYKTSTDIGINAIGNEKEIAFS